MACVLLTACPADDGASESGGSTSDATSTGGTTTSASMSSTTGMAESGSSSSTGGLECFDGAACSPDGACCSIEGKDIDLGQIGFVCMEGAFTPICPPDPPEIGAACPCSGPCEYDMPCGAAKTTVFACIGGAWDRAGTCD